VRNRWIAGVDPHRSGSRLVSRVDARIISTLTQIRSHNMPKYIIERNIPGANTLSSQELQEIAAKSNAVVAGLGEPYEWVTSYVAGDKVYCVHEAESAESIYRHGREGGFPVDNVTEVAAVIDPTTANGGAT
jgi:hypothetical protein